MKLALSVALFLLICAPDPVGAAPPNVLWITCEDTSPRLGCYGDSTVPTPNLDRFAEQGVRYTHAFGVYGVCAPNRHAIILGMYPTTTGAMAMRTHSRTSALDKITDPELLAIPTYEATPPPQARCFTEYLRQAGYYCSNNSKTDYQFRTPVTAWDDSSDDAHWHNRPSKDTPFFAVFNITTPHESGTFQQRSPRQVDPASVPLPPYYPDTPLVRRDIARHYDNIAAMDDQVGRLLGQLQEDGLADETIVFFFSDHGDGLPRMKRWVYDSGLHVPFLVRWPDGQRAGTTDDRLISFVDLAPTVLSLVGIDIPDYIQGRAFLGDQSARPRQYIFAARDRMDPAPETIRAVRDHRYKYVRNYRPDLPYLGFIPYRDQAAVMQEIHRAIRENRLGPESWQLWSQNKPLEELYDCEEDPHEIHNLASDPRYFEKLAELREAHERWSAETGDLGHIPESVLIKRLWPPDGQQPVTADPEIMIQDGTVTISCATEGASIAYRIGEDGRWLLYSGPFQFSQGDDPSEGGSVHAQAIRLGWKKSGVTTTRP